MSQATLINILGPDGALASHIKGYAPREAQLQMAGAVERALKRKSVLLVEAGTGTGKTFAYLAPALASGKKIIVSTGTKNLQDQLFQRDLPTIRAAMEAPVRTALLKGRANYLCLHRMEVNIEDGRLPSKQTVSELQKVQRWSRHTVSGDISEVTDVAEDSQVWPLVTSTSDSCLGQDCPQYEDCFLVRARKSAQEADVVVVNHHLFFADAAIKEEGFGELLPDAEAVIFDEAHQLPDVAALFFGESISSRQLLDLAQDSVAEMMSSAGEMRSLLDVVNRYEKGIADLRLAFGEESRKMPWADVEAQVQSAVAALAALLLELKDWLERSAARSKGLAQCFQRALDLQRQYELLTQKAPDNQVHWCETFKRGFVIAWTPLDVAKPFRDLMNQRQCGWVFASATLAVEEDFRHFAFQLGLHDYEAEIFHSPFDYEKQALFYLPRGLPDTSAPGYTEAMLEAMLPVLQASQGRAFLLFTSHRALKEAADWLPERISWPLLVQGSRPKAALLQEFREKGNAVLLGTGSFWEGVDVRGEALSCVIIDRLPFASPGEPVVAARIEAYKSQGKNAFAFYQLPEAIITLKQGAGRLIRDVSDTGVLVVCDPRLVGKPYAKRFLISLPPMQRTRSLERVQAFFAKESDDASAGA